MFGFVLIFGCLIVLLAFSCVCCVSFCLCWLLFALLVWFDLCLCVACGVVLLVCWFSLNYCVSCCLICVYFVSAAFDFSFDLFRYCVDLLLVLVC